MRKTMDKKTFLKKMVTELKRLEEGEHLSYLTEKGQYGKVDDIIKQLDYSALNDYAESENFEKLDISDIPEDYRLTFAIYLSGGDYSEAFMFEDWDELPNDIVNRGKAGRVIANRIKSYSVCHFESFEELMAEAV